MRQHTRNAGALAALLAMKAFSHPRLGLVSSYDKDDYLVKVRLQPDDTETGWLPIASLWVGQSWGLQIGPQLNDQAIVIFQEGSPECGVCLGFLYDDESRPQAVPAGELWLKHKQGAFLKLTNDPKLTMGDGAGATMTMQGGVITINATTINSAADWQHTGDITATGTVWGKTDTKSGSGAISGKAHKHTGVTTGSGTSGGPTN